MEQLSLFVLFTLCLFVYVYVNLSFGTCPENLVVTKREGLVGVAGGVVGSLVGGGRRRNLLGN